MSYHYLEAIREQDPHALHDVEVFHSRVCYCLGGCDENILADPITGKLPLRCPHCDETNDTAGATDGWFYAYLDGGLDCWSSDPVGPYDTEELALAAAREDAGFCPHGRSEIAAPHGMEPCPKCR